MRVLNLDPNQALQVKKRVAHFSKRESEVWGIKARDAMVVDNENVKIEGRGCSGEDERQPGHDSHQNRKYIYFQIWDAQVTCHVGVTSCGQRRRDTFSTYCTYSYYHHHNP